MSRHYSAEDEGPVRAKAQSVQPVHQAHFDTAEHEHFDLHESVDIHHQGDSSNDHLSHIAEASQAQQTHHEHQDHQHEHNHHEGHHHEHHGHESH